MDIEATVKNIRSIYQTLSGRSDLDVSFTYKGTGYGVTEPWHARIDSRECNSKTFEESATNLLDMVKKELLDKAKSAETEAKRLKQALANLGN